MPRTFDPWIGPRYESEGLDGTRLLILGESHYGNDEWLHSGFTKSVVQSQLDGKRYRLFTITAKLVLGRGHQPITNEERADFWERVAFANYIQSFVATSASPRTRPTAAMWQEAAEPFLQTVEELRPDGILVLGRELDYRRPPVPDDVLVHPIRHPSVGLSYAKWQPGVQDFMAALRARKT